MTDKMKMKLCLCAAPLAVGSKTSLFLRFDYIIHTVAMPPPNSLFLAVANTPKQMCIGKVLLLVTGCASAFSI